MPRGKTDKHIERERSLNLYLELWTNQYNHSFQQAVAAELLDKAHGIWCHAAEHYLYCLQQGRSDAVLPQDKPRRGQIMPLEQTSVASAFDVLHKRAATSYTAYAQKYIGRIQDMRNRIRRWSTEEDARSADTDTSSMITFNTFNYTITGLQRTVKDSEKRQAFNTLGTILRDQKKYNQTLLQTNTEGAHQLSYDNLDKMFKEAHSNLNRDTNTKNNYGNAQSKAKFDYENDPHCAKLYKVIRGDYIAKTSTITDPDTMLLTSNVPRIIKCMEESWRPIFNRLKEAPPQFDTFSLKYAQFFEGFSPAPTNTPESTHLYNQAQRASANTCAGRDAIKPIELKALPEEAWSTRKSVLDLAIKLERFLT